MKKNYVFPAVFHSNDDGSITITFPDLPGCISEGKSLENALDMAQKVLKQHLEVLVDSYDTGTPLSHLQSIENKKNVLM